MPSETLNPAAGRTASGVRDAVVVAGDAPEHNPKPNRKPRRAYAAQKAWHARNPWAGFAHTVVRSAERRGFLVRPRRCERCGEEKPLDAHHNDHRRPLEVRWWCRQCHRRHHADREAAIADAKETADRMHLPFKGRPAE